MGSVINVRTSARHRARGLGLRGGPRPCNYCGEPIRFARRDGRWRPVEDKGRVLPSGSTYRELHNCRNAQRADSPQTPSNSPQAAGRSLPHQRLQARRSGPTRARERSRK
jgi:hypothetical protein